ncbi:hypothetical protein TNCV_1353521 [Trichonephila clavipes]|nr:hypothetical protein TNCV_1353521 [Trichonephila clavipes]
MALPAACAAQLVFLNKLAPEEAFQMLSKYLVAVVFSALRESKILDFVQFLLQLPATNFWIDQISAFNSIFKEQSLQKSRQTAKTENHEICETVTRTKYLTVALQLEFILFSLEYKLKGYA